MTPVEKFINSNESSWAFEEKLDDEVYYEVSGGIQSNIATIVSNRIWMKVLYFNESR